MTTTLAALQSGSCVTRYIVQIEGVPFLLSDHDVAAEVTAALSDIGRGALPSEWDTVDVISGLMVDLKNSQTLTPWDPFTGSGRCTLRILDFDGSDTFGTYAAKRATGAETSLTATIDRNDTTINVTNTQNFTSSGLIFIGTECVYYGSKTATSFTSCVRGYYSPFQCAASGSGDYQFGNHHRVAADPNHVQINPVVTQLPRVWIGKRVGVWMHTVSTAAGTNALNKRQDAQLVFAGRIVGIADDPETFQTVIELEHIGESDIKNAVIGKDMWSATLAEGMYLVTGRSFSFFDDKDGAAVKNATALSVVASGASGTNQMNAGYYTTNELCDKLSAWLAGELSAGRIYGHYTFASPVTSNVGLRSKIYWRIEDASSTIDGRWQLTLPGEVATFLGFVDGDPGQSGQSQYVGHSGKTNKNTIKQGSAVPFVSMIFKPNGPGRLSQEFSDAVSYEAENERGTFVDQYSLLPASIKESCVSTSQWGLFLLDEKTLMVGTYSAHVLSNCWLAPFQAASDNSADAAHFIGRRADEPDGGPISLRQIFVFETTLSNAILTMAYSTGTSGYNHSTYDTLGYGLGWNMPGELLGPEFEYSVLNMPGADSPVAIVIDEPTKFVDLFRDDLVFRRSFLRWKHQHFEFAQWQTPMVALAAQSAASTDLTLTESNKAAPSGHQENHRIASQETDEHVRPIVKIDYCRDFGTDRGAKYLKSFMVEDQSGVDDAGGGVKPITLKLRNSFQQFAGTGSGVESLLKDFVAFMPVISKGASKIVRSIDMRYWEGYSVGDIAIVTDSFARDPLRGTRGIASRAALITRLAYDPGGPTASGSVRSMSGEVELMFLDVHRGELYAPSAQVDDTATNAGYDNATKTLTCYAQKYSHSCNLPRLRGGTLVFDEPADATNFVAGDKILIVEMDPANPASPDYWERTVASQTGNTIVMTATLSAPAWDSTKKYRITYQKYSQCQASQLDYVFQAADADEMVEDTEVPYHFSSTTEQFSYTRNTGLEKAEYVSQLCYGDGRPWDAGHDRALIHTVNAFIDYKSAHQMPFLLSDYWSFGATSNWQTVCSGLVYLGLDQLSGSLTRVLTLAPFYRSRTGGVSASIRVTLSRIMPQPSPSYAPGTTNFDDPAFTGEFSQTATWSTTSATWQTGADKTLSVGVKDLFFGCAWLVVEGTGDIECRGLGKCLEGPRVVG